jgi:Xaa-Pro dipeptidase
LSIIENDVPIIGTNPLTGVSASAIVDIEQRTDKCRDQVMLGDKARLASFMKKAGFDAVIGTSPENVLYLGGYWAMSQWIRRGPQAYAIMPAEGEPAIVTSSTLVDLIADQGLSCEVRRYSFFNVDYASDVSLNPTDARQRELFASEAYKNSVEALVSILKDRGLDRATIGIDEIGITPQCMEQLVEALPAARFARCFSMLEKVRSIKTIAEIERLRNAASVTEQSIEAAFEAAREGMTEIELARVFHMRTTALDGVPVTGCIGFGERSALSNVQPSLRRLKQGDAIRFDVGCRLRHYRSDISRIAVLGEPPRKMKAYHDALFKGVSRAYDVIKPGLQVSVLFDAVVETVRREGIAHYNRSHVGHGIGIEGYDPPNLVADSADVLQENMVICVETPYYELGFAGLQVEDMILVKSTGAESLMAHDGRLRVLS